MDELTVEPPEGFHPEVLVALSQLAGVEVEDLRHRVPQAPYAGRDPLDVAVLLAESIGPTELWVVLAHCVRCAFACEWFSVLE